MGDYPQFNARAVQSLVQNKQLNEEDICKQLDGQDFLNSTYEIADTLHTYNVKYNVRDAVKKVMEDIVTMSHGHDAPTGNLQVGRLRGSSVLFRQRGTIARGRSSAHYMLEFRWMRYESFARIWDCMHGGYHRNADRGTCISLLTCVYNLAEELGSKLMMSSVNGHEELSPVHSNRSIADFSTKSVSSVLRYMSGKSFEGIFKCHASSNRYKDVFVKITANIPTNGAFQNAGITKDATISLAISLPPGLQPQEDWKWVDKYFFSETRGERVPLQQPMEDLCMRCMKIVG